MVSWSERSKSRPIKKYSPRIKKNYETKSNQASASVAPWVAPSWEGGPSQVGDLWTEDQGRTACGTNDLQEEGAGLQRRLTAAGDQFGLGDWRDLGPE